MYRRILCASHGTPGAQAAEDQALRLCEADGLLYHLFVVPDFWKGMMGDDWLNNGVTRDRYGRYLENQLSEEAAQVVESLKARAEARNLRFRSEIKLGKPAACLLAASRREPFDLVVMGAPRPKGVPGLRARMVLNDLIPRLTVPLLIVPHPAS